MTHRRLPNLLASLAQSGHRLTRELRFPYKFIVHANKAARLQLLAHALELLARVLCATIEHAPSVKLVSPDAKLHHNGRVRVRFVTFDVLISAAP
jgi:hypothetical protein